MKLVFKNLSQKGFLTLHVLLPAIVAIATIGGVGTYVLTKSHAASGIGRTECTNTLHRAWLTSSNTCARRADQKTTANAPECYYKGWTYHVANPKDYCAPAVPHSVAPNPTQTPAQNPTSAPSTASSPATIKTSTAISQSDCLKNNRKWFSNGCAWRADQKQTANAPECAVAGYTYYISNPYDYCKAPATVASGAGTGNKTQTGTTATTQTAPVSTPVAPTKTTTTSATIASTSNLKVSTSLSQDLCKQLNRKWVNNGCAWRQDQKQTANAPECAITGYTYYINSKYDYCGPAVPNSLVHNVDIVASNTPAASVTTKTVSVAPQPIIVTAAMKNALSQAKLPSASADVASPRSLNIFRKTRVLDCPSEYKLYYVNSTYRDWGTYASVQPGYSQTLDNFTCVKVGFHASWYNLPFIRLTYTQPSIR